ncbi:hypothetical protein DPMN_041982 [Dreissena polymorpha]|uniref:Uncharacterized protein n=1 Tax=Dreissena polymorpha TaxID=45954 RepID=A0A9D4CYK5_DREPO|nr:hypothetical protein DPMN_071866 [Dreissena polymorpha]KAH3712351.1 hypothetical protein DPMN_072048 [Dreissena polymorpha]KAH3712355.1 hypothetical protein DPMN_072053 [Dreissena polymorpha]KAH3735375.1 hypothetical protein DPMN_041895 [Dreissena polymorpha]KAH3735451.1 hypothetical protein DPMN_041982 [Dreissena polymorpha]
MMALASSSKPSLPRYLSHVAEGHCMMDDPRSQMLQLVLDLHSIYGDHLPNRPGTGHHWREYL